MTIFLSGQAWRRTSLVPAPWRRRGWWISEFQANLVSREFQASQSHMVRRSLKTQTQTNPTHFYSPALLRPGLSSFSHHRAGTP